MYDFDSNKYYICGTVAFTATIPQYPTILFVKGIQEPTEFDSEFWIKLGQKVNSFSCPHTTLPVDTTKLTQAPVEHKCSSAKIQSPSHNYARVQSHLSNGICLAFGMLQQSPLCTTSGHCSRRSPWQRAILFSATTPLPNSTLTTLKSAVTMLILFYKSLRQLQLM